MRFLVTCACLISLFAVGTATTQEKQKNPVVIMDTSHGKIVVELYADKAPITVKNFLQYVDDKFYDGTIFHRVIADFMIQGGGLEPGQEEKKTRAPIKNEAGNGLPNERGTIAMARTSEPDSASAQFFINVKDNPFLDRARAADKVGYTVFGRVTDGMDVVDKIRRVDTNARDVPREDVIIRTVRRK
jgi:cyclophilin family peptidyl-prolyl cis-trans isomerase